jgi:hypothetical protein
MICGSGGISAGMLLRCSFTFFISSSKNLFKECSIVDKRFPEVLCGSLGAAMPDRNFFGCLVIRQLPWIRSGNIRKPCLGSYHRAPAGSQDIRNQSIGRIHGPGRIIHKGSLALHPPGAEP